MISIPVAHTLDALLFTLGSEFANLSATLAINFPELLFLNEDGKTIRSVPRKFADSAAVTGVLKSGPAVSMTWNLTTPATPDHLTWIIAGEKASLRIESDNAQIQMAPDMKLSMFTAPGEDGRESIYEDPGTPAWAPIEVPRAKFFGGVAEVYEAFAEGRMGALVDFEEATKRHRMVEAIHRSAEKGTRESYES